MRWQALTAAERRGFAPVCPDLVAELAGVTISHAQARSLDQWIERVQEANDLYFEGDGSIAIASETAYASKTLRKGAVDALLTLSSKGQLVIPARLRQLLGLKAGDRLALSLEADGLRLIPQDPAKISPARALIGCTGYQGPTLALEAMDPALFAKP